MRFASRRDVFLARQSRRGEVEEAHVPIDGELAFFLSEPATVCSHRLVIGSGHRSFSPRQVESGGSSSSSTSRRYTYTYAYRRFVPRATWQVTQPDTTLPPREDSLTRPCKRENTRGEKRSSSPLLQREHARGRFALLPGLEEIIIIHDSSASVLRCVLA